MFEKVEEFIYLEARVTNINDIREEIKRRMNMENACYYLVEKLVTVLQIRVIQSITVLVL